MFQLLDTHLLYLGLPDFVRHPGRGALGFIYLYPFALEEVHFLRASLPEPYICVAPVGRLQGCLAGRFAGKDADRIASVTVFTGEGHDSADKLYMGCSAPICNNDGDMAILKDVSGHIVSQRS